MNPTEIYQFLITLIHAGAEVFAASLIMFICGVGAGWWITQKYNVAVRRNLKDRVKDLETQVNDTQAKLISSDQQLKLTRENQGLTTKALDDAQKARDEVREGKADLQTRVTKLQQELHDEHTKTATVELKLKHTRDKLQDETKKASESLSKIQSITDELTQMRTIVASSQESGHVMLWKAALLDRHLTEKTKETFALSKQLCDLQTGSTDIEQKLGDAITEIEQLQQIVENKDQELALVSELQDHLDSVAKLSGKVWARSLPTDAPPFVPLGEKRRCPIISLLNLKGGVGKTTITLNLAAALSDKEKRVLLVDCDYQRSLTNLCLRPSKRRESHKAGRTLQRYLLGPDRTAESFLCVVHPLPNMSQASIVINTHSGDGTEGDGLAYVEEKVMLDWLLPPQPQRDIRFALRLALHSQAISGQYDYILLDCPPRFGTACINAIAASDFILIPILLDALSASGPLLHVLAELRKLRDTACSDFDILGVLANRVTGNNTDLQSTISKELVVPAKDTWS